MLVYRENTVDSYQTFNRENLKKFEKIYFNKVRKVKYVVWYDLIYSYL
jgi:hypothetical protein